MDGTKLLLAVALVATAAVGAGLGQRASASAGTDPLAAPTITQCKRLVKSETYAKGKVTVATDNPVYPPWFVDDTPSNQKGYESAVAYHIAALLGFKSSKVDWTVEPYVDSLLPGKKDFDFDIDEITYSAASTDDVSFSVSYFNVNESLVALKSSRIVHHHTTKELRTYLYGAQTGSPGLAFVKARIKPTRAPIAYPTLDAAVTALEHKQIAAIVVDTPSGQYLATQQVTDGTQFAQFKTTGTYYALVLQHDNPIVTCVDVAIKRLASTGTLSSLSKRWLSMYNDIPFIKP